MVEVLLDRPEGKVLLGQFIEIVLRVVKSCFAEAGAARLKYFSQQSSSSMFSRITMNIIVLLCCLYETQIFRKPHKVEYFKMDDKGLLQ